MKKDRKETEQKIKDILEGYCGKLTDHWEEDKTEIFYAVTLHLTSMCKRYRASYLRFFFKALGDYLDLNRR